MNLEQIDFTASLEKMELIEKLKENGFEELVDAFLANENKVYTKKGRLNKSGACRVMEKKPKQLEDMLVKAREFLDEI